MRNIFLISLGVWICFVVQYFLSEWFSPWFRPNLLLLMVIFLNLYRGIRHSFLVAFIAGLVADSFAPGLFGINIFAFMLSAYLTTLLKMYIYDSGSPTSRFLLVFLVSLCFGLIDFMGRTLFISVNFWKAFRYLMLPQTVATAAVSLYVLKIFKRCALKLFA